MSYHPTKRTTEGVARKHRLFFLHPGYIILLSWIPLAIGFFSGVELLLPLLITIPSFFVMRHWISQGQVMTAYYEMLLSCLWMSVAFILLCHFFIDMSYDPVNIEDNVIFKGKEYVADMQVWIETGKGTEGTPSLFIREHLIHMGIIIAAALLTGGFAALFFGAMQMGYMNFYVVWLIANSGGDPWAYYLAWPIWSVVRVFSFVLIAVVLAQPMLLIFRWRDIDVKRMFQLVAIAIVLEGIDIGLKTVIGPYNQSMLNPVVEKAQEATAWLATTNFFPV